MDHDPNELMCVSIVLCDEVYHDQSTRKMIVVGTFNTIRTPAVPFRLTSLSVLFTLTNGKGEHDLRVEIEHESSGAVVWGTGGPFGVSDPLQVSDIHLKIVGLELPAPGKYWVSVKSGEKILQQRPFYVQSTADALARPDEHQSHHPEPGD